jgi:hypothetical protein
MLLADDQKASRAAEFHHRALTEPYVSLSTHTAPSIRPFAYYEMSNGFALIMRLLPLSVGRLPRQDTAAPSVQPHYRAFSPTTDSSVPVPCVGHLILIGSTDLDVFLYIKTTGSHVPCKSLSRSHAAFEPDAAWAGPQVSAQTCPEMTTNLGFDIDHAFSTFHRRFACARLP